MGILKREKERFLVAHAVQSSALYDIWLDDHGQEEAGRRWASAQQRPVLPYRYQRFRAPPVSFSNKPRSTAGFRKICRFSDVEKMWHVIARDLLVAQHQPRSHIGDWLGRGREWQTDQIRKALTSSRQWVVCADVVRAFASVNIDAIYDLPYLPEPLTRRVIDYRSHRFVRRERSEYARAVALAVRNSELDVESSPSGLLEGSPASSAIFSVLMDDLPDHVGEDVTTFIYCDNIILIAPSKSRALRAREALVQYLSGHRAGPFELRSFIARVSNGFEHLGYTIRRQARSQPDVSFSLSGWNKLGERLENEKADLADTERWVRASYSRCSPCHMGEYMQRIHDEAAFRAHQAFALRSDEHPLVISHSPAAQAAN